MKVLGEEVTIKRTLDQAVIDNGKIDRRDGSVKELSSKALEKRVGSKIKYGRITDVRHYNLAKVPTLTEVVWFAEDLHLSVEEMIDRNGVNFPNFRNGVAWRLALVPKSTRARACRIAISRMLRGESVEEIEKAVRVVCAARKRKAPPLEEPDLREMAHDGLAMGLVRFEDPPGYEARAGEDLELALELERALENEPLVDGSERESGPVVRVVRNVVDDSFTADPVVPFLISRVAHGIVAEFIEERRFVFKVGIAGGLHCRTFVATTGPESSPFPDDSGDKQITFVPLTLEPFRNHQLPMADSVVGQMVEEARRLLGARRVDGMTLQSFGYVVDEQIDRLDDHVLTEVREQYRELDIAIYGCGDLESDGWLERVMRRVKAEGDERPVADVCLNLLAEDGSSISLPHGREFVGVGLSDIQRLVRRKDRLALMLTSGEAKGRSIVAAARAGCAGTIVCDQAAARAALDVLEEPSDEEAEAEATVSIVK